MKYFFIALSLMLASTANAQIVDDFTDGDFTNNPQWLGTTGNYIVNGNNQLQLNQTTAGISYLYTPLIDNVFDDKEWHFLVRQTFAGSGTNYGRVYLIANSIDLSSNPEGIYIQLGEANATDAIRLVQRTGGVTTVLCSTADGTIASSVNARLKITRDAQGVWSMSADLAGGNDLAFVATANEVAVPVGSNFGYLNVYTATNSNKFYLDDVYFGSIIVDQTPPSILSAEVINNQSVKILFSEPVDVTVLNPTRWSFSPNLTIQSTAWFQSVNTGVEILFTDPLINGQPYTFNLIEVEDLTENIAYNLEGTFSYLVAEVPEVGDIVINEIFPDPSPVIGLPEYEFVEIYNRSEKIFNLQGWKIGDNATQGTIGAKWLLPGEYAVLTANSNLTSFPGAVGVTSWPSLNNATDDVAIISGNGLELERLTYSLDWYNDAFKQDGGWTLERINPLTDCSDLNNWKASLAADGGTPGLQNSIFNITPDVLAPSLQSSVYNGTQLEIRFSEFIQVSSLDVNSIEFTPALTISQIDFSGSLNNIARLTLENVLPNQTYTFTLAGVLDCSGNESQNLEGSFSYMISEVAAVGDVVINEFMADPSPVVGLPEVEYVELYNRSNKVFNLAGWKLGDNATFGTIGTFWLQPGQYVVLTANANVSYFGSTAVGVTSIPSLGNALDDIKILSLEGELIDHISYSTEWYRDEVKKEGGWSIERINPLEECSSSINWRASINVDGGTPGVINSVYDLTPDSTPPALQQFYIGNDTLYVTFNEAVAASSISIASASINPSAQLIDVISQGALSTQFKFVFGDILPNISYVLSLSNVNDCAGNETDITIEFGVPSIAVVGDVIINEVLFDPQTGGSDYVELYNNSDKWIDLKGWKFAKYLSTGIGQDRVIDKHYLLQPKDYVVITADTNFVLNTYPYAAQGNFIQMSLPGLNADSSTLYLIRSNNEGEVLMDKLSYDKKWHFRLLENTKGKALERLSFDGKTQDKNNWYTASESEGWGTPGRKNSQYSPAVFNGDLNFASEVISPDNDGFEDVLQINYVMDKPGMVGTIRIYDDVGREIKLLINQDFLGMQGTYIWDGIRADGLKAKMGIYVLVMEAYNDQGDTYKVKKSFTVAGKL